MTYRTSVRITTLIVAVIMTSLPPEVGGLSGGCWYGREMTWNGDDAVTYKYVIPGDIQLGVILSIQQHDERRPCGTELRDAGVVQLVEAVVYALRFAPHHSQTVTRTAGCHPSVKGVNPGGTGGTRPPPPKFVLGDTSCIVPPKLSDDTGH